MGFLDIFRKDTSHLNDLKDLIVEYKTIIIQLREENAQLKEEVKQHKEEVKQHKTINLQRSKPKSTETNKKVLSKKEKHIYNFYNESNNKDINFLSQKLNIPIQHLRVYKSRIKKKGYSMNFE